LQTASCCQTMIGGINFFLTVRFRQPNRTVYSPINTKQSTLLYHMLVISRFTQHLNFRAFTALNEAA
jgi:hypothetical protein